MPRTTIVIYREADGTVPLLDWMKRQSVRVRAKCHVKIERLAEYGFQLRRPDCDFLRDGIFELRAREGRVHYRILYGFIGHNAIVLSHGSTKEQGVPSKEIDRAIQNLMRFRMNPKLHTCSQGVDHDA
jgi:phage-related protein